MNKKESMSYKAAGVDSVQKDVAMQRLGEWVERSFALRPGEVKIPLGYFANVIDGGGMGIAVSTDGVGTKILVAEMLERYDTVGIDCVAMNVNDVLCVGAEPLALLDYIAVQVPHPDLLEGLARGLYRGAELARITIPGGEIAQIAEMIKGKREGYGFDLVATCVGRVPLDRILTGDSMAAGDAIVGLASSGVHSNGLTLARKVFFEQAGWAPDRFVPELGRSIGEELLEPTRIYVREVREMFDGLRSGAPTSPAPVSDLNRAVASVGYVSTACRNPGIPAAAAGGLRQR